MAKEFKEYDKKFSKLKNSFLGYEIASKDIIEEAAANLTECWVKNSDSFARDEIRLAVYESESAEEWQKFRVSLKGMSTQLKLERLRFRYWHMKSKYQHCNEKEWFLEAVRIDNYIGALRRGGQLDAEYKIKR